MIFVNSRIAHLLVKNHLVFPDLFILLVIVLLLIFRKVNSHAFQQLLRQRGDILIDFGKDLLLVGKEVLNQSNKILPALV